MADRPAPSHNPDLAVVLAPGGDADEATRLSARLDVPLVRGAVPDGLLALRLDDAGLSLVGDGMAVRGDFARMLPRIRSGAVQRELLVRAARLKGFAGVPQVVDATAGLGEDALLLAAAGFEVLLYESDPVVAALLADALRRAAASPRLAPVVARMHLSEGDSLAALPRLPGPPDVVYLDPMFPERRKSAAVKKKFQLIHRLERPCSDDEQVALLQAALAARPRKVVVKRPVKGPYLAGVKPSYTVAGTSVRYDCIVPPRS